MSQIFSPDFLTAALFDKASSPLWRADGFGEPSPFFIQTFRLMACSIRCFSSPSTSSWITSGPMQTDPTNSKSVSLSVIWILTECLLFRHSLLNSEAVRARLISSGVLGADAYVVVAGPANVYAHYVTTREEYGVQRYEGASTIFGPCEYKFNSFNWVMLLREHRGWCIYGDGFCVPLWACVTI